MSKVFRIEQSLAHNNENVAIHNIEETRHKEVMKALGDVKKSVSGAAPVKHGDGDDDENQADEFEAELLTRRGELLRLKDEMRAIYKAIDDTKCQILTIRETSTDGQNISRAAEELSAIVKGTEEATNRILNSTEIVENNASSLVAMLKDESQQALACEIQDNIVNIFEACNFQDLTGQRITKVVKTFCFIEQRILKMMDIWGGADGFMDVTPEEMEMRREEDSYLNGPSLEDDNDVASQDDIDALFD